MSGRDTSTNSSRPYLAINLGWLFCCPPTVSGIASKLAFMPPEATYVVRIDENSKSQLILNADVWPVEPDQMERISMYFTTTSRNNRIALMHVRSNKPGRFTILYSHANAIDLGGILSFILELSSKLGCDIFSYDYSGYGVSTGSASEKNMYADIKAAWKFLTAKLKVKSSRIIVYGQSIGSVPSIDLASKYLVAGVVLHSAFMSGIRVFAPNMKKTLCCDVLRNIDKVSLIESPVLVMHGVEDGLIGVNHGIQLHSRCQNAVEPFWAESAGHNDIEAHPKYLERLNHFISHEIDDDGT